MSTYRLHRRWTTMFIFALLAVALSMSALSAQVRANESHVIDDHSVHPYDNANGAMLLLTQTLAPTASSTPGGPFDCLKLSLSNKRLFGNQFRIDIQNDNFQSSVMSRVQITWPNVPAYVQTGLAQMSLNTVAVWTGSDPQNTASATTTTDTATKPGNPAFSNVPPSDRTLPAQSASVYAATFNGPPQLSTYVAYYQYAITITIDNPLNPASPCTLTSPVTNVIPTPTSTGQPTPTATPTPDCATSLIAIKFNSFDNFGIVRFDILSQRSNPSTLLAFKINWQKYVNSQRLRKVSLVAPPGQVGAVVVWDANNINEDAAPSTNSKVEGTWLTDFTIPPGALGTPSTTSIYFDFDGIFRYDDYYGSTNPSYGGASDFDGSSFEFSCGTLGLGYPIVVTHAINPTPTVAPTPTAVFDAAPPRNLYTTRTPTLTWIKVTWAVGYQIQISTDINFDPNQTATVYVPFDVLTFTTGNLVNGTYYWRVKALRGKTDQGTWSMADSFVVSVPP